MHDPMVVAFEIRRPWPQRSRGFVPRRKDGARPKWSLGKFDGQPWWKPGSWSPFWVLAGRRYYWPGLITIWHVEPDGRDSGEVCKVFRTRRDGKRVVNNRWHWHVHHWKIQVRPLQTLRRWLLTRCEWCGGPSRNSARVDCSHQWDREPGRWWRGERGLFHMECSSAETASRSCVCESPVLDHDRYGNCARCCGFRAFGQTPTQIRATAVLRHCPAGQKPSAALLAEADAVRQEETASAQ